MRDFEEYKRQGEPEKKEKSEIWSAAIGLQQVDGLKPSEYLIKTAIANIEGDITFDEVKSRLNSYYQEKPSSTIDDKKTEEADKVSARIAEILSEKTFHLSPAEYIAIHGRLFEGIYKFAGKIRDYNITKDEWVLGDETVLYASANTIMVALRHDFDNEKDFNYVGLSKRQIMEHIAKFTSDIWQIHPFGEGNTRATAVFIIKYLRKLGFKVDNEQFAKHSWFFRNALVRSNATDLSKGIVSTNKFLHMFFGNLLLGEQSELKNRHAHINWEQGDDSLNDGLTPKSDGVNDGVKLSLSKTAQLVYDIINTKKAMSADSIAGLIKKSKPTVERAIKELKEKKLIRRIGSDKSGHWEII